MTRDRQKLATGRRWATVNPASFGAIPSVLPFANETFVLLLAADARAVPNQALRDLCGQLLKAGARYVCAWGPDCSRVHDACDLAAMDLGLNRPAAVIITTWHDQEPLKEAVWFAANAVVAISVGSKEWDAEIRDYLHAGTPIADEA
jgi:hypothetical protein